VQLILCIWMSTAGFIKKKKRLDLAVGNFLADSHTQTRKSNLPRVAGNAYLPLHEKES